MDAPAQQRFNFRVHLFSGRHDHRLPISAQAFLGLVAISCHGKSTVEPTTPPSISNPELADPIPFATLAQGKLVFERIGVEDEFNRDICVVDIAKKRTWRIYGGAKGAPAVSPDGKSILFTELSSGLVSGRDVSLMTIDGMYRGAMLSIYGKGHSPSWSPEGKQIFFYAFVFNGGSIPLYRQSPVWDSRTGK